MEAKTEEERNKERRQTLRIETGLCLKMREVWFRKRSRRLNNAGVVSVGHGIEPPGVSHWPVGPVLQLGPGGETATGGRTQSVLFSATSCWSDAPAWPSYEPLHPPVGFVHWQACWEMDHQTDSWLPCLVMPQSQWGIHRGHRHSVCFWKCKCPHVCFSRQMGALLLPISWPKCPIMQHKVQK